MMNVGLRVVDGARVQVRRQRCRLPLVRVSLVNNRADLVAVSASANRDDCLTDRFGHCHGLILTTNARLAGNDPCKRRDQGSGLDLRRAARAAPRASGPVDTL
jgi:hypothetical protein